jgi:hypothetical protein
LRALLPQAERLGLQRVLTLAKVNMGLALARLGALDEGLAVEREALAQLRAAGDRRFSVQSQSYLATILRLAGDLVGAESAAREAVGASEAPPLHATSTLAQVLLAHGQPAEALEWARPGLTVETAPGAEGGSTRSRLVYAEALSALGDQPGARQAIADASRRLRERAAWLGDAALERVFLSRVPDHARTLALAQSWNAEAAT